MDTARVGCRNFCRPVELVPPCKFIYIRCQVARHHRAAHCNALIALRVNVVLFLFYGMIQTAIRLECRRNFARRIAWLRCASKEFLGPEIVLCKELSLVTLRSCAH